MSLSETFMMNGDRILTCEVKEVLRLYVETHNDITEDFVLANCRFLPIDDQKLVFHCSYCNFHQFFLLVCL